MLNSLRRLSALLLLTLPASAQQGQAPPKAEPSAQSTIPVEAVRQVNPVKPTPESLAEGKRLYGYDCAMCHGANGDGKGDLANEEKEEIAKGTKTKISDFTDPDTLKTATDGELFYIIKNGKGDMPPEGSRAKQDQLWNLVNYIRSIAKKKSPSDDKPPQ